MPSRRMYAVASAWAAMRTVLTTLALAQARRRLGACCRWEWGLTAAHAARGFSVVVVLQDAMAAADQAAAAAPLAVMPQLPAPGLVLLLQAAAGQPQYLGTARMRTRTMACCQSRSVLMHTTGACSHPLRLCVAPGPLQSVRRSAAPTGAPRLLEM